jgi:hypothetical protein
VMVSRTRARPLLTRAPGEFRDPRLLEAAADRIKKISVKTSATEIELERDGPSVEAQKRQERPLWRITRPIDERADQEFVDRLLTGLVTARALGFTDNAVPIGAAESVVQVKVWAENGPADGESFEVFPGSDAETCLVRLSGRPVAARASADLLNMRSCNVEQMRDTHLAALDPRRITTMRVDDARAGTTVLHLFKNHWYVAHGTEIFEANRERIAKVIRTLNEALILAAHDQPGSLDAYGLDRPFLELTFGTPVHSEKTTLAPLTSQNSVKLRLGEANNRFFAQWDERQPVYRFDGAILAEIPREWIHYRSPRLLSFAPLSVRELIMTVPPMAPVELKFDIRRDPAWSASRQDTDVTPFLDKFKLERLVNRLSELSAHDWVVDPSAAAKALENPTFTIRITIEQFDESSNAAKPFAISVAFAPISVGQRTALYYGRVNDEADVFTIRREVLDELMTSILVDNEKSTSAIK